MFSLPRKVRLESEALGSRWGTWPGRKGTLLSKGLVLPFCYGTKFISTCLMCAVHFHA